MYERDRVECEPVLASAITPKITLKNII